jgi:Mg/Co/Ni transporter MgtE
LRVEVWSESFEQWHSGKIAEIKEDSSIEVVFRIDETAETFEFTKHITAQNINRLIRPLSESRRIGLDSDSVNYNKEEILQQMEQVSKKKLAETQKIAEMKKQ